MNHQLQELLQQGTAPVAPVTQPQGQPRQLLDYHAWLSMQTVSRAQSQPTKVTCRKPKRVRTGFTTSQLNELELEFSNYPYVSQSRRKQLANQLELKEHTITVWFQNRRMKEKRNIAEAQQSSTEAYEGFHQPTLYYQRVAQNYPMGAVPLKQNLTPGQYEYSPCNNQLIVPLANRQKLSHQPDVNVLPLTPPVTPPTDSQKLSSLGSTREEIIENLLLLQQHSDVAAATEKEMQSTKDLNSYMHSPCLYGETAPFVSFPEQHYPHEVEYHPVMERGLPALEGQAQHIPSDLMDLFSPKGGLPAVEEPAQHLPSDLMDFLISKRGLPAVDKQAQHIPSDFMDLLRPKEGLPAVEEQAQHIPSDIMDLLSSKGGLPVVEGQAQHLPSDIMDFLSPKEGLLAVEEQSQHLPSDLMDFLSPKEGLPAVQEPDQHLPVDLLDLLRPKGGLPAVEKQAQHIPSDLMDLPFETLKKDMNINNYL